MPPASNDDGTGLERTAALAVAAVTPPSTGAPEPSPAPAFEPGDPVWMEVERRTAAILVVVALVAGLAATVIGLLLGEAIVRPLRRISAAAAAVASGDLARRSGVTGRRDEIGELATSFDRMAEALERAAATRRAFLQDAAHELGTPVTSIHTTVSAILDGVYAPEARHLETIRDESRLLARVVDDLRTIALAEGGRLPIDPALVDMARIARSALAAVEARAAVLEIQASIDGPPAAMAWADPDRALQVLGALLDNAVRHTPPGGAIDVHVAELADHVVVEVRDTGPGLGSDPSRVFDRFYRADPSRDRSAGHAGLGLAIVRALVEAQGGRVAAANGNDRGAVFRVELPRAPGNPAATAHPPAG